MYSFNIKICGIRFEQSSLVAGVTYSDIFSGLDRWCLLCVMSLRMVIYWFYCT